MANKGYKKVTMVSYDSAKSKEILAIKAVAALDRIIDPKYMWIGEVTNGATGVTFLVASSEIRQQFNLESNILVNSDLEAKLDKVAFDEIRSTLVTTTSAQSLIQEAIAGLATKEELALLRYELPTSPEASSGVIDIDTDTFVKLDTLTSLLATKANTNDVYTKSEINSKNYATTTDLNQYALKSSIPDVSQFLDRRAIIALIKEELARNTIPAEEEALPLDTPSKTIYYGNVASLNSAIQPSEEQIKSAPNQTERESLVGWEITLGSDEEEGYAIVAFPTSVAASTTYTNTGNQFTQQPAWKGNVNVGTTEYHVDVFEYSYGSLPFRLS